jgi:eukaryotic-like serine/threonine-protein kinase
VPRADQRIVGGRYDLGERIGAGGMGDVFAATDRRSGEHVAVKLIRASLLSDRSARRRFAAEASVAERIDDPNVVRVLDHGDDHGQPFLVMERLPGGTLRDRLAHGPMSSEEVRDLGVQVLAGLAAAHAVEVIHRDVKPGNVLDGNERDGGTRWKIADFGIAKWLGDDVTLTATGELVGSAAYLAPERVAGRPASEASDLYAVGVLLYEALCGRKPFVGDDPFQIATAIRAGDFDDPRDVRPDADPALSAAIARAMQLDPRDRFTDTKAFAKALEDRSATTLPGAVRSSADAVDETAALPPLDVTTPVPVAGDADVPVGSTTSVRTPLRAPLRAPLRTPLRAPPHDLPGRVAPATDSPWTRLRRMAFGSAQRTLVTLAVAVTLVVAIVAIAAVAGNGGSSRTGTPRSATSTPAPTVLPTPLEDALRRLEAAVKP